MQVIQLRMCICGTSVCVGVGVCVYYCKGIVKSVVCVCVWCCMRMVLMRGVCVVDGACVCS